MKKIIVLVLYMSIIQFCFAQKNTNLVKTKSIIKIGLSTYLVEDQFVFGIVLEHKIATNKSLQLEVLPLFSKNRFATKNGIGFVFSYRNYLRKNSSNLSGIYISPLIKAGLVNIKYNSNFETKVINFNAAFLFGKQWIFENKLVLDLNGGLGFFKNYSTPEIIYFALDKDKLGFNKSGISPNINLKIGYSF